MFKQLAFLLFFVCSVQSFSQKLTYKSNGTILNSENQKLTSDQVRELLANNEKLLADYNSGRSKKTAGNILLYGGLGLAIGNTLYQMYKPIDIYYDSNSYYNPKSNDKQVYLLSYIGLASIIASIPIKIGFSKKIKNVVTEYNNQKATGNIDFNNPKLNLIANSNGIGLRLSLN